MKILILFVSMFWLFQVLFSLFDPSPNPMIKVPRAGVVQGVSQQVDPAPNPMIQVPRPSGMQATTPAPSPNPMIRVPGH